MTYYNTVHHAGHERFAHQLVGAGVVAALVPDLPLEESGPWCVAADAAGIETVMFAAPTAPDERLPRIAARARGFVYSVGLLGVTGERRRTCLRLRRLWRDGLKAITDMPVLIGVGVSNAAQARQAVQDADGVVMGASVISDFSTEAPRPSATTSPKYAPRSMNEACELCEAARLTEWFYEDEMCWIAECEQCYVPMVVWKHHDAEPPAEVRNMMLEVLGDVVRRGRIASTGSTSTTTCARSRITPRPRPPRGGFFGHGLRITSP